MAPGGVAPQQRLVAPAATTRPVYGLLILLVAALLWFALRQWHRRKLLSGD